MCEEPRKMAKAPVELCGETDPDAAPRARRRTPRVAREKRRAGVPTRFCARTVRRDARGGARGPVQEVLFAEEGSDTERGDGDAAGAPPRTKKRAPEAEQEAGAPAAAAGRARATSARLSRACRPRRTRWRVPCSRTTTIPPRPLRRRCCARRRRSTPRRRRRRTRGRAALALASFREASGETSGEDATPLRRRRADPRPKQNRLERGDVAWQELPRPARAARRARWRHRPRADCSAPPRRAAAGRRAVAAGSSPVGRRARRRSPRREPCPPAAAAARWRTGARARPPAPVRRGRRAPRSARRAVGARGDARRPPLNGRLDSISRRG